MYSKTILPTQDTGVPIPPTGVTMVFLFFDSYLVKVYCCTKVTNFLVNFCSVCLIAGECVHTDVSHDIHVTCMSVGRAVSKLVCVLIDWEELLVLLQYEFTNKDILALYNYY